MLRLTPQGSPRRRRRRGRALGQRRDPGRARRDPRQAPVSGAGVEAGRRALPRRHPERRADRSSCPPTARPRSQFTTPKLDPAVRACIRDTSGSSGAPDPLEFDDMRYFTFKVQPALKVVVVSDLAIDAEFVARRARPRPGHAPARARPGRSTSSRSGRRRSPRRLGSCSRTTRASCCSTSHELDRDAWGRLSGYVRDGGGLVVGLGNRCLPEHYASPIVAQLLPATLEKAKPAGGAHASARSPTSRTRSSAAIPRSSTRCWRRCRSITYWTVKPHQGCAHAPDLRRQCPRAGRADLQRAQDRPRPALDDARWRRRADASRPRPGMSFPHGLGGSTT